MSSTKECLYCVSEITDGFRFNGETDMRVWEKSLALTLCDAGAPAVRVGAIVLELRIMIYIFNVSKSLGMPTGQCVTNPDVLAYIQFQFDKGLEAEDTAKRAKAQFPLFPWTMNEASSDVVLGEDLYKFSL